MIIKKTCLFFAFLLLIMNAVNASENYASSIWYHREDIPPMYSFFIFATNTPPYYEIVEKKGYLVAKASGGVALSKHEGMHIPTNGIDNGSYSIISLNNFKVDVDGVEFDIKDKAEGVIPLGWSSYNSVRVTVSPSSSKALIAFRGNGRYSFYYKNFIFWDGETGYSNSGLQIKQSSLSAGFRKLSIVSLLGEEKVSNSLIIDKRPVLGAAMNSAALSSLIEKIESVFKHIKEAPDSNGVFSVDPKAWTYR